MKDKKVKTCPHCRSTNLVEVHCHIQCQNCLNIIEPCCQGTAKDWDAKNAIHSTIKGVGMGDPYGGILAKPNRSIELRGDNDLSFKEIKKEQS